MERFLFEARATALFSHPNIVTIHAVGERQGMPYLALEYLEGQTLRRRLEEERLSVAEAMRVALAIALALREAHPRGLAHRDLKPENVMLGRDGRLRVLDFGLALLSRAEATAATVAPEPAGGGGSGGAAAHEPTAASAQRPAGIAGTPAYMAPEQWEGREGPQGAMDM